MKTIVLNILVFLILILSFVSCVKDAPLPIDCSSNEVEQYSDTTTSLKTGEEDDDEPVPMYSINGVAKDSLNNPVQAFIELSDSMSGTVIYSTYANSYGYFQFDSVVAGTYDVIIWINGNIYETRRVTVGN